MKNLLLAFVLLFSAMSFGVESEMNLNRGNINIAGGVTASTTSYDEAGGVTNQISLTPGLTYFVMDKLAVGAELNFTTTSSTNATFIGIGPQCDYYFWTQARMASYVTGGVFLGNNSESGVNQTVIRPYVGLGMKFFLIPSVALGPTLFYQRELPSTNVTGYSSLFLSAIVSVYL